MAPFTSGNSLENPLRLAALPVSRPSPRTQIVSFLLHALVLIAILFLSIRGPVTEHLAVAITNLQQRNLLYTPAPEPFANKPAAGHDGGGGNNNSAPATHGFIPPRSFIQLAPPRLPDKANHLLPVPATILDKEPPANLALNQLGVPWMSDYTNSAGPGKNDGFGKGKNGGIGDDEGPYAGQGADGPYARGISMPTCAYCPYPAYSDEARRMKLQGSVTLRVLVGIDGKSSDIRVVRGLGFGLDEEAVQTVRTWRFSAARDAQRHPVPAWITVEAIFRLF